MVGGLTHGLYRYPARFSPEFVAAALETFSEAGDLILDPFVGGGTSAVESVVRGRRFVGFDINPLAVLLTRVKTDPLTGRELAELERWCEEARAPVSGGTDDVRLRNAPPELVDALAPYVAAVNELSTDREQRAARTLLLDVAQWAVDGKQNTASATQIPTALVRSYRRFERGMRDLTDSARLHGMRPSDLARRRAVRLGPAQAVAASRPLDRFVGRAKLAVTSPPYPGIHVLYHRWQVRGRSETPMAYWLADANDGLGPKHYTMGGRSSVGEDLYFAGIRATWESARRLLRDDAVVLQLVAFGDEDTQLPRFLATMAEAGYRQRPDLEPGGWRAVPNRRWYYRVQPGRNQARERLIAHEPG
jgi:hypothetical protein